MKPMLFIGFLVSFIFGCAAVPSGSHGRNPLGDWEISAGDGTFVFRDVVLSGNLRPGSWIMTGVVQNNTGQNWKHVVFGFQLYDMTRNISKSQIDGDITVTINSWDDGDVKAFTTNPFKALLKTNPPQFIPLKSILKYEVAYKGIALEKLIFVMIKPWESREPLFEDQSIRTRFTLSEKQIGITLQNKMQSPIKLDWNNVSYVDITGLAHGVIHTGVRFIERDRPQVPTLIPPSAMIEDAIVPSDYISYTSGSYGGWSSRALFPTLQKTDLYSGKSFSVFMPLEIEGTVKNYLVAFRIEREAP